MQERSDAWVAYLVAEAIPTVESLAKKCLSKQARKGYSSQVDFDDLVQQGALGAVLAVRHYQLSKGSFPVFAYKWIWGQMEECFRRKNLQWMMLREPGLPEPLSAQDLARESEHVLLGEVLAEAVGRLSLREQVILQQYYFDAKTQAAIAEANALREGTVSELRHKALKRLRLILQGDHRGQALREVFGGEVFG